MSPVDPVNRIGAFLEQRAREATPIFYNDLARGLGLPPVTDAWLSHPLCEIFDALDVDDHAHGRPFRTAMVVNRETSIPGEGFFKTVQSLRKITAPRDPMKRIEFWKKEFDELVAFYAAPA